MESTLDGLPFGYKDFINIAPRFRDSISRMVVRAYLGLSGPVKVPAEVDKEIFIIVRGVAQPG